MAPTPDVSTAEGRKLYKQQLLRELITNRDALQQIATMEVSTDEASLLAQKRLAIKEVKEQSEVILGLLREMDE